MPRNVFKVSQISLKGNFILTVHKKENMHLMDIINKLKIKNSTVTMTMTLYK